MELEIVGEDLGERVVVLVEDRLCHAVHRVNVWMVTHWSSNKLVVAVTDDRTKRGGPRASCEPSILRQPGLSSSTDITVGRFPCFSRCVRSRSFVRSHRSDQPRGDPT